MNVGMRYGLLLAVAYSVAWNLGGVALAALFSLFALQLIVGTVIVWRRTRLPYAAMSNLVGAVGAAAAALHFATVGKAHDLTLAAIIFFIAAALMGPLLLFAEARLHPEQWNAWREHMTDTSLTDLLLGRHIPRLPRERT